MTTSLFINSRTNDSGRFSKNAPSTQACSTRWRTRNLPRQNWSISGIIGSRSKVPSGSNVSSISCADRTTTVSPARRCAFSVFISHHPGKKIRLPWTIASCRGHCQHTSRERIGQGERLGADLGVILARYGPHAAAFRQDPIHVSRVAHDSDQASIGKLLVILQLAEGGSPNIPTWRLIAVSSVC